MLQARAAVCAVFPEVCCCYVCLVSNWANPVHPVFRTLCGVLDQERGRGDVKMIVSSLKITLLVPGIVCTAAHC